MVVKPKVSIFIAMSLDGFIARTNGSIDWLDKANLKVHEGEDFGYTTFLESVDTLILGRNTYETVLEFDDWPYKEKRIIVLTTNKIKIPINSANTVTSSNDSPQELLKHKRPRVQTYIHWWRNYYSKFPLLRID